MKTPGYWSDLNPLSLLLSPLGLLYNLGTRLNMSLHKPQKAAVPVVCIGNLTAGGTGKTPTAVSIAKLMQQAKRKPFFVSRGYGGNLHNVLVDPQHHTPQQVGDEPLLLARQAPTVVNPDRFAAAQTAAAPERKWSLWMTVFKIPACIRICHFLFLTAVSVTAMVCAFRPGPCGKACLPE